ncbi:MAG: YggT family protein [Pseudomonadaceae bacterium]|nr:YggT family protein [Pseudomonadaceae bacterium]
MTDIANIIIDFLLSSAVFLFLLRFVLQLVRADFYNPICQAISTLTDPVLRPLRMLLPPFGRFDAASLVTAWLLQCLHTWGLYALAGSDLGALPVIAYSLLQTLLLLTQIFFFSIIISAIASWFVQGNYHPVLALVRQIIEPITAPLRKIIPVIGGLDISPIFALLGLMVLQQVLRSLFASLPL